MTETNQHLTRVEKHVISPSDEWYRRLAELCALSKNLYNHANYLARQAFFKEGKWLRYTELDQLLKKDLDYPDYRAMPTAQSAQQTLRLLEENWASFFASIVGPFGLYCAKTPKLKSTYRRRKGLWWCRRLHRRGWRRRGFASSMGRQEAGTWPSSSFAMRLRRSSFSCSSRAISR